MAKNRNVPIFEVTTGSPEETQALGERLGKQLAAGDVVALSGELGAGKTTLVQGLARGLGLDPGRVKSPTFVLVREHPGRVPLIHVDGYRLDAARQAVWLDLDLIFSPHKVTVVEWAERLGDAVPAEAVRLELSHVSANRRRVRGTGGGPRAAQILAALAAVPAALAVAEEPQAPA